LLSPGSILEVHDNKALVAGGGLFVSFRNMFTHLVVNDETNRLCFIQYQIPDGREYPPAQWKVLAEACSACPCVLCKL